MLFPTYPYINVNDLNLDYILKQIRVLTEEITNFVSLNAIKYADPIQWDITSQYEKNTVVIDGNTGTAYISVQPVPKGVSLFNTDYWTVIFTLDILSSNHNITLRDDGGQPTATFASDEGDWILWNGVLYRVSRPIVLGETYVVGYNLDRYTVEMFVTDVVTDYTNAINTVVDYIGDLANLTTTDKTSVVNAINEVVSDLGTLGGKVGDLATLTTTDKTSIVNAINEVLTTLVTTVGDLANLTTTDKTSIVNAINEVVSDLVTLDGKVGDLANLTTTDKTSLVNAINEINAAMSGLYDTADIRNYGGVGDGVTNDTAAFVACMAENNVVYLPNFDGCAGYVLDEVTLSDHQHVHGDAWTPIIQNGAKLFTITGDYVSIESLDVTCSQLTPMAVFNIKHTGGGGYAVQTIIRNITTHYANTIISDSESTQQYVSCLFDNILGYRTRGTAYYIHHAFAFIFMDKCVSDRVTLQVDNPAFDFDHVEGAHLTYCECSGGYLNATNASGAGFKFADCKAIWLDDCFSDYMSGSGYVFSTCEYVHITNCGASLTGLYGYFLSGCNYVEISNCYIAGADFTAASVSGVYVYNCTKLTMTGCNVSKYTYNGIYTTGGNLLIFSGCTITTTTQAAISLNSDKSIANGCVSDNTMTASGTDTYILNCVGSSGFIDTRTP